MSWAATACASIVWPVESRFSKRPEASERSPSRDDVRWMFGPIQVAASISTRVVPSWTSERLPPITPAIDVGPAASSMTTIWSSSVRVTSSSVTTCSPGSARRTTSLPPSTRSASNACSGWPVSSIT